eukprot:6210609-Pleurochrysis_carterae.AAC.1
MAPSEEMRIANSKSSWCARAFSDNDPFRLVKPMKSETVAVGTTALNPSISPCLVMSASEIAPELPQPFAFERSSFFSCANETPIYDFHATSCVSPAPVLLPGTRPSEGIAAAIKELLYVSAHWSCASTPASLRTAA